ncbi:FxSxx-COOH cyclophane-containing RiPP peptide [Streptomyces sp. SLBN-115]|uniref:FxSxx-COOH cyclophane-containing RiPP peptide n=1 Tax=Streptomyces sp. SLBN-115 TaxID=2768453 RepID=UPI00115433F0|nr:FxSxx-COOH cyclophane-containing RiPP peptide [Streptomyces sp. SLBN-115]TQJ55659.1 FXSXX-COOH protein [Streptomyces sp. SLBN-115]
MDSSDRTDSTDGTDRVEPTGDLSALPDLTELSLVELATVQHPLLQEVLADLRERARRPSEMLWGWANSF